VHHPNHRSVLFITYDPSPVQGLLQLSDLFPVLDAVVVQQLNSSAQKVELGFVVGQLLVLTLDLLSTLYDCAIGLFQSAQSEQRRTVPLVR